VIFAQSCLSYISNHRAERERIKHDEIILGIEILKERIGIEILKEEIDFYDFGLTLTLSIRRISSSSNDSCAADVQ